MLRNSLAVALCSIPVPMPKWILPTSNTWSSTFPVVDNIAISGSALSSSASLHFSKYIEPTDQLTALTVAKPAPAVVSAINVPILDANPCPRVTPAPMSCGVKDDEYGSYP